MTRANLWDKAVRLTGSSWAVSQAKSAALGWSMTLALISSESVVGRPSLAVFQLKTSSRGIAPYLSSVATAVVGSPSPELSKASSLINALFISVDLPTWNRPTKAMR